jgi:hypothetical protein
VKTPPVTKALWHSPAHRHPYIYSLPPTVQVIIYFFSLFYLLSPSILISSALLPRELTEANVSGARRGVTRPARCRAQTAARGVGWPCRRRVGPGRWGERRGGPDVGARQQGSLAGASRRTRPARRPCQRGDGGPAGGQTGRPGEKEFFLIFLKFSLVTNLS